MGLFSRIGGRLAYLGRFLSCRPIPDVTAARAGVSAVPEASGGTVLVPEPSIEKHHPPSTITTPAETAEPAAESLVQDSRNNTRKSPSDQPTGNLKKSASSPASLKEPSSANDSPAHSAPASISKSALAKPDTEADKSKSDDPETKPTQPDLKTKSSSKQVSFDHSQEVPMAEEKKNDDLHAVVDMGSNGIRFSITDLKSSTRRVLPIVFQDRCGVSLYDAQYRTGTKGPIPAEVIEQVVTELKRFKQICQMFQVASKNIRIIATEATRNATNSIEYRKALEDATGWTVEMLPKEEEGRIGALGVASSFSTVQGLVMDLGGGSTQLTWLIMKNGHLRTSPKGSVSLAYGAAALTQRLRVIESQGKDGEKELESEITQRLSEAISDLQLPDELINVVEHPDGIQLYLSGGGFRGWGYLLMSTHQIKPYPIPLINGFSVKASAFRPEIVLKAINNDYEGEKIFRVSKRRRSQVPSVSLLIDCLLNALPNISQIYFAQGGVREGALFSTLPAEVQAQDPLNAATVAYASRSASAIAGMLKQGIPTQQFPEPQYLEAPYVPDFLAKNDVIVTSLAHLLHFHAPLPKDSRAAAGLRSTTTGLLAGIHGLAHETRALLALALCSRWGDEIAPVDEGFYHGLVTLVGPRNAWWCHYLGLLGAAIGERYPAGIVDEERCWLKAKWEIGSIGKYEKKKTEITIEADCQSSAGAVPDWAEDMEKLGKKKHWFDGEGVKIRVNVTQR